MNVALHLDSVREGFPTGFSQVGLGFLGSGQVMFAVDFLGRVVLDHMDESDGGTQRLGKIGSYWQGRFCQLRSIQGNQQMLEHSFTFRRKSGRADTGLERR